MLKVAPCTVIQSYSRTTKFLRLDALLVFCIVMGLCSASSTISYESPYFISPMVFLGFLPIFSNLVSTVFVVVWWENKIAGIIFSIIFWACTLFKAVYNLAGVLSNLFPSPWDLSGVPNWCWYCRGDENVPAWPGLPLYDPIEEPKGLALGKGCENKQN